MQIDRPLTRLAGVVAAIALGLPTACAHPAGAPTPASANPGTSSAAAPVATSAAITARDLESRLTAFAHDTMMGREAGHDLEREGHRLRGCAVSAAWTPSRRRERRLLPDGAEHSPPRRDDAARPGAQRHRGHPRQRSGAARRVCVDQRPQRSRRIQPPAGRPRFDSSVRSDHPAARRRQSAAHAVGRGSGADPDHPRLAAPIARAAARFDQQRRR